MTDDPIFRGWNLFGSASRKLKRSFTDIGKSYEARQIEALAERVQEQLEEQGLVDAPDLFLLASRMARSVLVELSDTDKDPADFPLFDPLALFFFELLENEELFSIPKLIETGETPVRSEIWETEDQLRRTLKVLDNLNDATSDLCTMARIALEPIVRQHPALMRPVEYQTSELSFDTLLAENLSDLPQIVEAMVQLPFAPKLEEADTTKYLKDRLEYNLVVASGGLPGDPSSFVRTPKLPTKVGPMSPKQLIKTYLEGTPFAALFTCIVPITIPQATRFEHHHIVAGSGHGKTQTLQHLILHDLDAVAECRASIVVIDSQSDLINNIANLEVFAPGGPLAERLVLIDPTDVEYPVALNLFDIGMERINQYSQLDREKLINGVLELYDFVLGSLLDAGMTQKQSIIFRYITRLLLHIPNATIHTFRELLEDDGYETYRKHIEKLEGSARAFFENEFRGSEFKGTRKQVLRRLYGILENQTFERMFSHPKSKLDLFSEMNAGKVILINTAKDLLKENGTEILGRFFIAMIAQAAQERAVLQKEDRLPTFVYVDEANDYFDRNIGIILSQARKFNIGMVLAHQFLGQLDSKLQEAILANTAIKFAGGVSAKDSRALAAEMRTEPAFIENQDKLSFAAFIKGSTKTAVSLAIEYGAMEREPTMSAAEKQEQREAMRDAYAVHYKKIGKEENDEELDEDEAGNGYEGGDLGEDPDDGDDEPDDGKPMKWE